MSLKAWITCVMYLTASIDRLAMVDFRYACSATENTTLLSRHQLTELHLYLSNKTRTCRYTLAGPNILMNFGNMRENSENFDIVHSRLVCINHDMNKTFNKQE